MKTNDDYDPITDMFTKRMGCPFSDVSLYGNTDGYNDNLLIWPKQTTTEFQGKCKNVSNQSNEMYPTNMENQNDEKSEHVTKQMNNGLNSAIRKKLLEDLRLSDSDDESTTPNGQRHRPYPLAATPIESEAAAPRIDRLLTDSLAPKLPVLVSPLSVMPPASHQPDDGDEEEEGGVQPAVDRSLPRSDEHEVKSPQQPVQPAPHPTSHHLSSTEEKDPLPLPPDNPSPPATANVGFINRLLTESQAVLAKQQSCLIDNLSPACSSPVIKRGGLWIFPTAFDVKQVMGDTVDECRASLARSAADRHKTLTCSLILPPAFFFATRDLDCHDVATMTSLVTNDASIQCQLLLPSRAPVNTLPSTSSTTKPLGTVPPMIQRNEPTVSSSVGNNPLTALCQAASPAPVGLLVEALALIDKRQSQAAAGEEKRLQSSTLSVELSRASDHKESASQSWRSLVQSISSHATKTDRHTLLLNLPSLTGYPIHLTQLMARLASSAHLESTSGNLTQAITRLTDAIELLDSAGRRLRQVESKLSGRSRPVHRREAGWLHFWYYVLAKLRSIFAFRVYTWQMRLICSSSQPTIANQSYHDQASPTASINWPPLFPDSIDSSGPLASHLTSAVKLVHESTVGWHRAESHLACNVPNLQLLQTSSAFNVNHTSYQSLDSDLALYCQGIVLRSPDTDIGSLLLFLAGAIKLHSRLIEALKVAVTTVQHPPTTENATESSRISSPPTNSTVPVTIRAGSKQNRHSTSGKKSRRVDQPSVTEPVGELSVVKSNKKPTSSSSHKPPVLLPSTRPDSSPPSTSSCSRSMARDGKRPSSQTNDHQRESQSGPFKRPGDRRSVSRPPAKRRPEPPAELFAPLNATLSKGVGGQVRPTPTDKPSVRQPARR